MLQLHGCEKIVILGNNGSGKSTLLKAILDMPEISKSGSWISPKHQDIGYIDQHYSGLNPNATAVQLIQELMPKWLHSEIRNHLNTFLLRKNEEVNLATKYLSGGEKVRLNLALIAAKPPKLLILDEITNNVDLETKEHLIQVLSQYPGSILLVCHEQKFINNLNIDNYYTIKNGTLSQSSK